MLVVYAFFGSAGTFEFRRVAWEGAQGRPGQGYYHSLAEGFRRGQLSIVHPVDPKIMALPHPYDFHARHNAGAKSVWDASYFNGRYYLYFTALPVVLFYLPYRVIANGYPPDSLAAVVFCTWAFVMAALFVRRAVGDRPLLPLWIVMLGLGNFVPFLLPEPKVYENAVFTGMAMSATWAYALLRYVESPTRWRMVWVGLWLALAVAARPNLIVLLLITVIVARRKILFALIPLALVGAAMMTYNYARFLDPFELGERYQLTFVAMQDHRVCGVCNIAEGIRVINHAGHYLFWGPSISSAFPFVDLRPAALDPATTFPSGGEQIAGVAPMVPLAIVGSLFALIGAQGAGRRAQENDAGAPTPAPRALRPAPYRAARLLVAGAWLILLALSTCWWVTARYALDFMLLMTIGAIVCVEAGTMFLADSGVNVRPLRIALVVLACWSIAVGFMLGFEGVVGSFERVNPELFQRLAAMFA